MRNLTIQRTKAFAASLAKIKIYIEDPLEGNLIIDDIPCRKIGELKNGEEKTFLVEEQALRVYVIVDQLSKNYCRDYYQLPAGTEDVFLSGRNRFNPSNGNAFRFDNNDSPGVEEFRQAGVRKGRGVLLISILVGAVVGAVAGFWLVSSLIAGWTPAEKVFSVDGMSITLTEAFKEIEVEDLTAAYDSRNVGVLVTEDPFTWTDGLEEYSWAEYSLEEYADLVIEFSEIQAVKTKTEDGLFRFEYDYTAPDEETYRYFAYIYKADDAFWLVEFAVLKAEADRYLPDIAAWAKSVTFSGE